ASGNVLESADQLRDRLEHDLHGCSDRPASHRWASSSRRRSGVSVTLPIRAHQSLRQVYLRGERGPPRGPAPPAPVWAILGLATFCVHLLRDGQNGDQSEAGRLSRRVILGQKTTLGATDLLCHSYQRKPCAYARAPFSAPKQYI